MIICFFCVQRGLELEPNLREYPETRKGKWLIEQVVLSVRGEYSCIPNGNTKVTTVHLNDFLQKVILSDVRQMNRSSIFFITYLSLLLLANSRRMKRRSE